MEDIDGVGAALVVGLEGRGLSGVGTLYVGEEAGRDNQRFVAKGHAGVATDLDQGFLHLSAGEAASQARAEEAGQERGEVERAQHGDAGQVAVALAKAGSAPDVGAEVVGGEVAEAAMGLGEGGDHCFAVGFGGQFVEVIDGERAALLVGACACHGCSLWTGGLHPPETPRTLDTRGVARARLAWDG